MRSLAPHVFSVSRCIALSRSIGFAFAGTDDEGFLLYSVSNCRLHLQPLKLCEDTNDIMGNVMNFLRAGKTVDGGSGGNDGFPVGDPMSNLKSTCCATASIQLSLFLALCPRRF